MLCLISSSVFLLFVFLCDIVFYGNVMNEIIIVYYFDCDYMIWSSKNLYSW